MGITQMDIYLYQRNGIQFIPQVKVEAKVSCVMYTYEDLDIIRCSISCDADRYTLGPI